jgi:hypothetical protein
LQQLLSKWEISYLQQLLQRDSLILPQGRENKPELYENDVIGKVAKRKKNDIWTRGGEKRTKFKDE